MIAVRPGLFGNRHILLSFKRSPIFSSSYNKENNSPIILRKSIVHFHDLNLFALSLGMALPLIFNLQMCNHLLYFSVKISVILHKFQLYFERKYVSKKISKKQLKTLSNTYNAKHFTPSLNMIY